MQERSLCCVLSLTAFLAIVGTSHPSGDCGNGLSVEMTIEPDTLLVAEPIWVDVTMENHSDKRADRWCVGQHPMNERFELRTLDGERLPYTGVHVSSTRRLYLEPGGERVMTYDLLEHFGQGLFVPPKHIPPGIYEVRLVCGGLCQGVSDTIVVVEPTGGEMAAYELFALGRSRFHARAVDAAIEALEEVISLHPDSRYCGISLKKVIDSLTIIGRKDEALAQTRRLLAQYPNSGFSIYALNILLYNTRSKAEGMAFLDSTIAAHPGTRAEVFAKQLRAAIERGDSKLWTERHLELLEGLRGEER
jgi:hypothetical protein